jgi:hypothetical protein
MPDLENVFPDSVVGNSAGNRWGMWVSCKWGGTMGANLEISLKNSHFQGEMTGDRAITTEARTLKAVVISDLCETDKISDYADARLEVSF